MGGIQLSPFLTYFEKGIKGGWGWGHSIPKKKRQQNCDTMTFPFFFNSFFPFRNSGIKFPFPRKRPPCTHQRLPSSSANCENGACFLSSSISITDFFFLVIYTNLSLSLSPFIMSTCSSTAGSQRSRKRKRTVLRDTCTKTAPEQDSIRANVATCVANAASFQTNADTLKQSWDTWAGVQKTLFKELQDDLAMYAKLCTERADLLGPSTQEKTGAALQVWQVCLAIRNVSI